MKVAIIEKLEDGSEKQIALFWLQNGVAACDNSRFFNHLLQSSEGAIVGARGKRFFPRDGEAYLRSLSIQYKGPYLYARTVEEVSAAPAAAAPAPQTPPAPARPARRTADKAPGPPSPNRAAPEPPARDPAPEKVRHVELNSRQKEEMTSGLVRLAHALRALDALYAAHELDRLLDGLAQIFGTDADKLLRRAPSSDESLALRFQKPLHGNYPKLWEKVFKAWAELLGALPQGDLGTIVPSLALIREALALLPAQRAEWLRTGMVPAGAVGRPVGTATSDHQQIWAERTAALLRSGVEPITLIQKIEDSAAPLFEQAVASLAEGHYGRAEGQLRAALTQDPGHVEARCMLGEVLRRTDRTSEALVELTHATEVEWVRVRLSGTAGRPTSHARLARAHQGMARCLLAIGQVRVAGHQLELALEHYDHVERRQAPSALADTDRSRLRAEAEESRGLLTNLLRAMGEDERALASRRE